MVTQLIWWCQIWSGTISLSKYNTKQWGRKMISGAELLFPIPGVFLLEFLHHVCLHSKQPALKVSLGDTTGFTNVQNELPGECVFGCGWTHHSWSTKPVLPIKRMLRSLALHPWYLLLAALTWFLPPPLSSCLSPHKTINKSAEHLVTPPRLPPIPHPRSHLLHRPLASVHPWPHSSCCQQASIRPLVLYTGSNCRGMFGQLLKWCVDATDCYLLYSRSSFTGFDNCYFPWGLLVFRFNCFFCNDANVFCCRVSHVSQKSCVGNVKLYYWPRLSTREAGWNICCSSSGAHCIS